MLIPLYIRKLLIIRTMAIIGKIREKSGLLVTMVGLGLFLFIIPVNDLLQQFSGGANSTLGLFNNSEIDANDWKYYNRENLTRNNLRINNLNSGGNGSLTSADEDQIKVTSWNQMISDTIYYYELSKLGIKVSADELNQGLLNGENPLPSSLKELFVKKLSLFLAKLFSVLSALLKSCLTSSSSSSLSLKYSAYFFCSRWILP